MLCPACNREIRDEEGLAAAKEWIAQANNA